MALNLRETSLLLFFFSTQTCFNWFKSSKWLIYLLKLIFYLLFLSPDFLATWSPFHRNCFMVVSNPGFLSDALSITLGFSTRICSSMTGICSKLYISCLENMTREVLTDGTSTLIWGHGSYSSLEKKEDRSAKLPSDLESQFNTKVFTGALQNFTWAA